ncbi:MAG TPA: YCF48-related protein [Armatimonadota bacterium]
MRQIIMLILAAMGGGCQGHWAPAAHPAPAAWRTVRARPGGLGWAAGDAGLVFATVDGGSTWTPQSTPLANSILSVDFGSALVGWVSGVNGDAARTADGGASWVQMPIAKDDLGIGPPDSISPIVSPDEAHAWALARWLDTTVLYHTANAGSSWSTVAYTDHGYASPNTLYGMGLTSDTEGWLVASRLVSGNYIPVLLRTVDGGTTWQPFDAPATQLNGASDPAWEVAIQAVSTGRVWVSVWDTVNSRGNIFRLELTSPPNTWTWSVWPWNSRVREISFSGPARGILAGDSTWETPDLFATVHTTTFSGAAPLAADFASQTEGYAAGPDGVLYRWIPDLWGDANQDGRVDVRDACIIADIATGGTPDASVSRVLADVDGDGQVTVADAVRALRIAGGLAGQG